MSRVVLVHETGGPEVMKVTDRAALSPGAGEVVIRNEAIGLNFVDVYQRTGLYKMPLPLTPGGEGAGTVSAVGGGVTDLKVGDRVLYSANGAYADEIAVPRGKVVALPDDISTEVAATLFPLAWAWQAELWPSSNWTPQGPRQRPPAGYARPLRGARCRRWNAPPACRAPGAAAWRKC